MRGKVLGASKGCDGVGITPACAGKSASHGCGSRGWRDHPRVCGEKCYNGVVKIFSRGSPPRMRGKVRLGHATKSVKVDHPRVCGEKHPFDAQHQCNPGSPPRMRGKVFYLLLSVHADGITPAYAGKSHCIDAVFCVLWDHPRVCGEKPV